MRLLPIEYEWWLEDNIYEICICLSILLILSIFVFFFYVYKRYAELKLKGYEFVYYFLSNFGELQYYRLNSKHIQVEYNASYQTLLKNRKRWFLYGGWKKKIERFISFFEDASETTKLLEKNLSLNHYFAYSELTEMTGRMGALKSSIKVIVDADCEEYVSGKYKEVEFKDLINKVRKSAHHDYPLMNILMSIREIHNKEFVDFQLKTNKKYFDELLSYPLDEQQRESIVKLEDNCLVISSAGSGKTSTSIAKVKYLLDKQRMKKEEILVVSYNKKTADEFQERLNIPGLTCKTFHAFASYVIGKVEGKKPNVCEPTLLLTCYYDLVKKNPDFKAAINKFVSEVSSLTKFEHQYERGEDYHKDRETYGIMSPYGDMNGSSIFTRSEEEKKICIWLSSHNVDFLYEQPYPENTADTQYRQYKPDFTIYFTKEGKRYYLFLEHFGIDKDGNVPIWFGEGYKSYDEANRRYNNDIIWKRELHANNNTRLLETTSAMFHDGTIYQKLEQQLKDAGVPMRLLSEDEKYEKMIKRNKAVEDSIMTLFSSFISLMKSNGKTFDSIMKDIKEANKGEDFNERCRYLMYELIKPLYDEYERCLKEKGQMDFTDLVLKATDLCNSGKYKSPYSYILVDEFQDISIDRYKFILSLRRRSPLTKTFCVGDDWQSIYRFSGSDMNLFNHFEKYFGYTERCKIETTYRFGNPLVERSSEFILKNPNQVKKEVHPLSDSVSTELSFIPFKRGLNDQEYLLEIKRIIESIPSDETIMLMARYNYEVEVFPKKCVKQQPNSKRAKVTYAGWTMDFMSVHAAKGLEADNVIILNCSQDQGGFPSRITDDPILGFVLSEIDTFEYSEERRLFYVAITRAKKHTFVMYNTEMPSVFVTEMQEKDDADIFICPRCKRGRLKIIKEAKSVYGTPYRNYLCSNSVAGCRFFWQVYYVREDDITTQYHTQMDSFFHSPGEEPLPQKSPTHMDDPDNLPF